MGKRGPKAMEPTEEQRDKVRLYMAGGLSEPVIASIFGISDETLRTYFRDDLKHGRSIKISENLVRLEKAAEAGNVAAMKYLASRFEIEAASAEFLGKQQEVKPPRVVRPGKKVEAAQAALTAGAGSDWGNDLQVGDARAN